MHNRKRALLMVVLTLSPALAHQAAPPSMEDVQAAVNAIPNAPAMPPQQGTAASTLDTAGTGSLDFDQLASTLENFGGGGLSGAFPAIGTGIALLQGATSLLTLIPGMAGLADGINKFLGFVSSATATLAPIMAVAKTVGHYMRLLSSGQQTVNAMFGARSLDDATAAINSLTGLAGQTGLIDPARLKTDPAAAARQVAQTFDQQIARTKQQSQQYANYPAVQAAINARIARLNDLRALSMRKVRAQARIKDITANSRRSADLAASTAESAMTLTAAAASVTDAKDAGKLTVAAVTQSANATTAGLANVSDQMTQQAALTLGTNESLDQLVEQAVTHQTALAAKHEADMMDADVQSLASKNATVQMGQFTTSALARTLTPRTQDSPNFVDVLNTGR